MLQCMYLLSCVSQWGGGDSNEMFVLQNVSGNNSTGLFICVGSLFYIKIKLISLHHVVLNYPFLLTTLFAVHCG
jgi:hypothetical protein